MDQHYSVIEIIGESEDTEHRASWGFALYNDDTSVLLSRIHPTRQEAIDFVSVDNNWGTVVGVVPEEEKKSYPCTTHSKHINGMAAFEISSISFKYQVGYLSCGHPFAFSAEEKPKLDQVFPCVYCTEECHS